MTSAPIWISEAEVVSLIHLPDAVAALEGTRDEALRGATALARVRRLLAEEVARRIGERIRSSEGSALDDLCLRIQRGELDLASAAEEALDKQTGGGDRGAEE